MGQIVLLCGLPFAGKSTLAASLQEHFPQLRWIRLDDWMLANGYALERQWPREVWEQAHQFALSEASRALSRGEIPLIDDTHYLFWLRDRYRQAFPDRLCSVIYVCPSDRTVWQRWRQNEREPRRNRLSGRMMERIFEALEEPGPQENPLQYRGEPLKEWLPRFQAWLAGI